MDPWRRQIYDRTTDIPVEEVVEPKFQYPGIPTTCDGAEAVVHVEIHDQPGGGRLPDHQLDHDGRRVQRRRS